MTKARAWTLISLGTLLIQGSAEAQVAWVSTDRGRVAQPSLLDRQAQLVLHHATLADALTRLSEASGVPVAFSPSLVAAEPRRVDCDCLEVSIGQALDHLLENTAFSYRELRGEILVGRGAPEPAVAASPRYAMQMTTLPSSMLATFWLSRASERRQGTVTGVVTELGTQRPLATVQVQIVGTNLGGITDAEGRFEIRNVPAGEVEVQVQMLGYATASQTATVPAEGIVTLNFQLERDVLALDELIVIGYGEQRRSDVTGAISTVRGEEITRVTSGGLQEAIQGRMAGVNITPTSGMPGGALDMNIRGVATLGSGNPLFVIDGLPLLSEGSSRNFNPLANLNPDNIESIQIFKDASASAIYGARAANGVVIITTNTGANQAPQVQFRSSAGVATITDFLPMMNSEEFIPYSAEAYRNAGTPIPVAWQEPLLAENLQRNTDWQKEAFSSATTQNYWLGISGGSENATYMLSGGYLDQGGSLPNSGFKRYSARLNTDLTVGNRLRIGESLALSRATWTGTFDQTSVSIPQLLQQSPTVPVHNPDAVGGFDGPRLEYGPVGRQNSIGRLSLDYNERTINQLLGSGYIEFELLPGLSNRFNVGAEITLGDTFQFLPTYDMGDRNRTRASLNESRINENVYLIENTTTFRRVFGGVHDIAILAGLTRQQAWGKTVGVSVRTFPSDDLRSIAAGFEHRDIDGNETGWALLSQLGRINYTYNDTYNLLFSIRRDGSSRFGRNNRYGVFPSVSGNWIVTNESFFPDSPLLSYLRLRASYGQVGSQDIGNFAQYATISQGENYVYGRDEELTAGSTYLNVGNPDLKWEVTTQANLGLDVGLFDQRLSVEMDAYIKDTDDILLQAPIPTTSGIRRDNGPFVNAGSMRNTGFELAASYQNELLGGDLAYAVSGNIATNRNRVTSVHGDLPIIVSMSYQGDGQQARTITEAGLPIGSFQGFIMEGVFADQQDVDSHAIQPGAAPGDVKFRDVNGDGVIDAGDMTVIGDPFPTFTYGFDINLSYKNFSTSILLHGKQGHEIYNLVWADLNEGNGDNNATTDMLRRWTPENRITDVPRAVFGDPNANTRPSTRFIEDGSFLRIQSVQLEYTVPSEVVNRFGMSGLRLFLAAKNLHTFTNYRGYNPEIGVLTGGSRSALSRGVDFGMYPIPRTFEVGLEVDLN